MAHNFPEGYPKEWIEAEEDMPPDWYIAFALSGDNNISDKILKQDLSTRFPELSEDAINDAVTLGKNRVKHLLSNAMNHTNNLFG
jgi:hypothetical protein